jgi:chemotaxis protein MotB
MRVLGILVLCSVLSCSACVSRGRYDAAVADATRARQEASSLGTRARVLQASLERARLDALERDAMLARMTASRDELQRRLDEQTAVNQKLGGELQKLGKDVDALLKEGGLGGSIAEAKRRLAELRKAQAAAEARAQLYGQLLGKFKKMIDAGDLKVGLREGRMVLQLSNDVLFDSGKATLKPAGKQALDTVASVLAGVPRRFQIAGHTDDEPIKLSPYASNWELSTVRALTVVEYLLSHGMKGQALSAAGYGEFDPVAENATPSGRAMNRRIEITLQPEIQELVTVP